MTLSAKTDHLGLFTYSVLLIGSVYILKCLVLFLISNRTTPLRLAQGLNYSALQENTFISVDYVPCIDDLAGTRALVARNDFQNLGYVYRLVNTACF